LQERLIEPVEGAEVLDVARCEAEVLQVIEHVRQAGEDEVGAVGRVLAKKRLKAAVPVWPLCQ
jgi:hypothetical protein